MKQSGPDVLMVISPRSRSYTLAGPLSGWLFGTGDEVRAAYLSSRAPSLSTRTLRETSLPQPPSLNPNHDKRPLSEDRHRAITHRARTDAILPILLFTGKA